MLFLLYFVVTFTISRTNDLFGTMAVPALLLGFFLATLLTGSMRAERDLRESGGKRNSFMLLRPMSTPTLADVRFKAGAYGILLTSAVVLIFSFSHSDFAEEFFVPGHGMIGLVFFSVLGILIIAKIIFNWLLPQENGINKYRRPSTKRLGKFPSMSDEMFFSDNSRSLRRGKRTRDRTDTCRPCLIWDKAKPKEKFEGVVLDMTPYGLRIRMFDVVPKDTIVLVQLMRDESFEQPLSEPVEGHVVRHIKTRTAFTDHGVKLVLKDIRRQEPRPIEAQKRPSRATRSRIPRMHNIDFIVGDDKTGR